MLLIKSMMTAKATQALSSRSDKALRQAHRHKIPSKSSCESEIIGLHDKVGDILWTRQFLEAQGYKIDTNILYQDNISTLSLAKNGYVSSSKRTKHIKAKYFFVRHYHHSGELDLQYCPTETMWADVLTKPLQGAKFRLMRTFLMNCPIDYHEETPSLPNFTPYVHPTLVPRRLHPHHCQNSHRLNPQIPQLLLR
jgi:hypothetical protein